MDVMKIPYRAEIVALLAEGVDRNIGAARPHRGGAVALLAEGVDRNKVSDPAF